MDDPEAKPRDQLKAAIQILDRAPSAPKRHDRRRRNAPGGSHMGEPIRLSDRQVQGMLDVMRETGNLAATDSLPPKPDEAE